MDAVQIFLMAVSLQWLWNEKVMHGIICLAANLWQDGEPHIYLKVIILYSTNLSSKTLLIRSRDLNRSCSVSILCVIALQLGHNLKQFQGKHNISHQ